MLKGTQGTEFNLSAEQRDFNMNWTNGEALNDDKFKSFCDAFGSSIQTLGTLHVEGNRGTVRDQDGKIIAWIERTADRRIHLETSSDAIRNLALLTYENVTTQNITTQKVTTLKPPIVQTSLPLSAGSRSGKKDTLSRSATAQTGGKSRLRRVQLYKITEEMLPPKTDASMASSTERLLTKRQATELQAPPTGSGDLRRQLQELQKANQQQQQQRLHGSDVLVSEVHQFTPVADTRKRRARLPTEQKVNLPAAKTAHEAVVTLTNNAPSAGEPTVKPAEAQDEVFSLFCASVLQQYNKKLSDQSQPQAQTRTEKNSLHIISPLPPFEIKNSDTAGHVVIVPPGNSDGSKMIIQSVIQAKAPGSLLEVGFTDLDQIKFTLAEAEQRGLKCHLTNECKAAIQQGNDPKLKQLLMVHDDKDNGARQALNRP